MAGEVTDLVAERAAFDLGAEMPQTAYFDVLLTQNTPPTGVAIQEFWIDHQTGQFIANLLTQDDGLQRISGFALLTLPVPVPTRRLLPGDIIRAEDVETIELPWQRVHAFAVLEPEDLIGKQTKRMLAQGRPIQHPSITPPILVSRGEQVKIHLQNGGLRLVTTGKAIDDAHMGQEVRVLNLSSNKTITAIAKADGIVEVHD